jgi:hypothetical protein
MDIIDILQLNIEIFKVDAHASDELNNYVDRKVKLIHDQSSDYGLVLCNQPLYRSTIFQVGIISKLNNR